MTFDSFVIIIRPRLVLLQTTFRHGQECHRAILPIEDIQDLRRQLIDDAKALRAWPKVDEVVSQTNVEEVFSAAEKLLLEFVLRHIDKDVYDKGELTSLFLSISL